MSYVHQRKPTCVFIRIRINGVREILDFRPLLQRSQKGCRIRANHTSDIRRRCHSSRCCCRSCSNHLKTNYHRTAAAVKRAALHERPLRIVPRRDARRERKSRVRAGGWPGCLPVESVEIGGTTFLRSGSRSAVRADPKRQVEHVRLKPNRPV